VWRLLVLTLLCTVALAVAPPVLAGGGGSDGPATIRDRVEDLQEELDSLTEEVEDLQEPVEEFELFDECMYVIGVTEYGSADGSLGYLWGSADRARRRALALDIRGFGRSRYQFLAFPGEEPPSIECNEDAGEEFIDG
jgi:hypothetical protein